MSTKAGFLYRVHLGVNDKVIGRAQVGTFEGRAVKYSSFKVAVVKVSVGKIALGKVSALKYARYKIGAFKLAFMETGAFHIAAHERYFETEAAALAKVEAH